MFDFENVKTEEDFKKVALNVVDLLNTLDRLWISSCFTNRSCFVSFFWMFTNGAVQSS